MYICFCRCGFGRGRSNQCTKFREAMFYELKATSIDNNSRPSASPSLLYANARRSNAEAFYQYDREVGRESSMREKGLHVNFGHGGPNGRDVEERLAFCVKFFIILPLYLTLVLLGFCLRGIAARGGVGGRAGLLSRVESGTSRVVRIAGCTADVLVAGGGALGGLQALRRSKSSCRVCRTGERLSGSVSGMRDSILGTIGKGMTVLAGAKCIVNSCTLDEARASCRGRR